MREIRHQAAGILARNHCRRLRKRPKNKTPPGRQDLWQIWKGAFPRPSFGSRRKENNYRFKFRLDGLALRKATNARPNRPVPSNSREDGSGVRLLG